MRKCTTGATAKAEADPKKSLAEDANATQARNKAACNNKKLFFSEPDLNCLRKMKTIICNEYFMLSLTFGVFFAAKVAQRRLGWVLLNPILVAVAVIIAFLLAMDIPYNTYHEGAKMIEFWLKPAVVALGVPLYMQLSSIKRQLLPILASQTMGCVAGIVSVVAIAKVSGASDTVVMSLASKSVTTPIAMEVTQVLGGIPSLTAAIVVITGLIGAIVGFKTLAVGHVNNPMALGLSMGAASHALGTSAAMERDQFVGAYASLGLTLNGILTALLTPTVIDLIDMC